MPNQNIEKIFLRNLKSKRDVPKILDKAVKLVSKNPGVYTELEKELQKTDISKIAPHFDAEIAYIALEKRVQQLEDSNKNNNKKIK